MVDGVGKNYLEGSAGVNYLARRAVEFIGTFKEVHGKFGYDPQRDFYVNPVTDPFCVALGCATGVRQIYEALQLPQFASHGGLEKIKELRLETILKKMEGEVQSARFGPLVDRGLLLAPPTETRTEETKIVPNKRPASATR